MERYEYRIRVRVRTTPTWYTYPAGYQHESKTPHNTGTSSGIAWCGVLLVFNRERERERERD